MMTKFLAADSLKLTVTISRDGIKLWEHKENNQFSEQINNYHAYF